MIMVYAIEEVNKKRELGNITLGYHIVDSCGEVSAALENVQVFMRKTREYSQRSPNISSLASLLSDWYLFLQP